MPAEMAGGLAQVTKSGPVPLSACPPENRHIRQEPQIAKSRHFAREILIAESAQYAIVL
jgi:hypothetical protein